MGKQKLNSQLKFLKQESSFLSWGDLQMTCYFRHLKDVFKKARIEITKDNKREIDRVIHGIVGVEYKNCSAAWKEVKKKIIEDEAIFVSKLKESLG